MTKENLFKKIHQIQISALHLAEDLLAGSYKSAFKGSGMEFEEVREFQNGDDVRNIDWNVTARMGHFFVKHFREERELTVFLVVDLSLSSHFGGNNGIKSELISEIAAVLAFSAIKNNDKVGLITFDSDVDLFLPPKKGRRHVLRVIRELLIAVPKNKDTDLKKPFSFLGKVQNRRAICFVISDFICPDFTQDLAVIAKKHEIIAICVTDPYEIAFPDISLTEFEDLETGALKIVDTSFKPMQKQQQKKQSEHLDHIKKIFEKSGGSFIDIRTDKPYIQVLKQFFKNRRGRT